MIRKRKAAMGSERCVRVKINGYVQGIGFRAETQDIAQKHGITGKAVNCPDGSVEVTACGEEDSIAKLVKWLHQGPDKAKVESVTVESVDVTTPKNFTTG